mmetsp:Transcript_113044/g.326661  ORF Transcript_113044/g.326661 Transcript_113044/m.326661 type:complete len:121 (+) Transcript_113044:135-497(+)
MAKGRVIHCASLQEYEKALREAQDKLVVVDCYANWCAPCRAIAPVFETLSLRYNDIIFVKIDVDRAPEVKNLLGVWALPTFCFVRNGQKISSFTGANERSLRRGLENEGDIGYCSSCVLA